jgi:uncharacterized protein
MSEQRGLDRRQLLKAAGLGTAGLVLSPWLSRLTRAADETPKKVLFFTKSSGFQHSVINRGRTPDKLSMAERVLTDLGAKHGFEVTCSKDGGMFAPDKRDQFDAFVFYTTGDLTTSNGTDPHPGMTKEDKAGFLDAIKAGKGFMALHCGSDTFHSPGYANNKYARNVDEQGHDRFDPYIQMLGGEFIVHGAQQFTTLHCVDEKFPGAAGFKDARWLEEWYSLNNFAPDLHVILLQETKEMKGPMYQRKPYPETWARMHGKGRVVYSSMGHRDEFWNGKIPAYHDLLIGALNWITGRVEADVTPNLKDVAPDCETFTA